MKLVIILALLQGAATQPSETPLPSPPALVRAVPAGAILIPDDFTGEKSLVDELAGKETRRFMPAGAAVRNSDVRAPVLVSRNKLVRLQFVRGALAISAEGRALSNGALGESVRVIALRSKSTITGVVAGEGLVQVQ